MRHAQAAAAREGEGRGGDQSARAPSPPDDPPPPPGMRVRAGGSHGRWGRGEGGGAQKEALWTLGWGGVRFGVEGGGGGGDLDATSHQCRTTYKSILATLNIGRHKNNCLQKNIDQSASLPYL